MRRSRLGLHAVAMLGLLLGFGSASADTSAPAAQTLVEALVSLPSNKATTQERPMKPHLHLTWGKTGEKRSYTGQFLKELLARRPAKRRAEAAE